MNWCVFVNGFRSLREWFECLTEASDHVLEFQWMDQCLWLICVSLESSHLHLLSNQQEVLVTDWWRVRQGSRCGFRTCSVPEIRPSEAFFTKNPFPNKPMATRPVAGWHGANHGGINIVLTAAGDPTSCTPTHTHTGTSKRQRGSMHSEAIGSQS